jgi:hypothetical protein
VSSYYFIDVADTCDSPRVGSVIAESAHVQKRRKHHNVIKLARTVAGASDVIFVCHIVTGINNISLVRPKDTSRLIMSSAHY